MRYPTLYTSQSSRQMIDNFGGYNHNLRIGDSEWYDMENMSSDLYPVLSPRKKRGKLNFDGKIDGVISNNGLCYVKDGKFICDGEVIEKLELDSREKNLVSMGAYVIILPDKKWVNVVTKDHGRIEAWFVVREDAPEDDKKYKLYQCWSDGKAFENVTKSDTEPEEPEDGALWLDTSGEQDSLKQWSGQNKEWVNVITNHIRIDANGIGASFEPGDSIVGEFHGIHVGNKATVQTIGEIVDEDENGYGVLKCTWVIESKGESHIVIRGNLGALSTGGMGVINLHRKMPDMDFVIESGNRLWGCKYGDPGNGFVNEIYASKLGDFKNWYCFQGISTDSYAASLGTDGPFTGAVNYNGRPVFFKENSLVEVYGAYPAQYQIQSTVCNGVQSGSSKSLAMVNNVLFYKSADGVYAFDGSLPALVSSQLGDVNYRDAAAGGVGNKYYISMKDQDNNAHLFVYDTRKTMWHREDNLDVHTFCAHRGELYGICDDRVLSLKGSANPDEKPVFWMLESGEMGISLPDAKYVSKLNVRMWLAEGSEVSFYVQYEEPDQWQHLCTVPGTSLRSFDIPVRPRRCDHMKLRIEGTGDARIYSITKTIAQGSDVT